MYILWNTNLVLSQDDTVSCALTNFCNINLTFAKIGH